MKNIMIEKSRYFPAGSKVYVHIGTKTMHIKGYELYPLSIDQDEDIIATHLWTKSNKINYEEITDKSLFYIYPRLGKKLAAIILTVFIICLIYFLLTGSRWSFIPLLPFAIYIGIYLTILKNRYLIIKIKEKE